MSLLLWIKSRSEWTREHSRDQCPHPDDTRSRRPDKGHGEVKLAMKKITLDLSEKRIEGG